METKALFGEILKPLRHLVSKIFGLLTACSRQSTLDGAPKKKTLKVRSLDVAQKFPRKSQICLRIAKLGSVKVHVVRRLPTSHTNINVVNSCGVPQNVDSLSCNRILPSGYLENEKIVKGDVACLGYIHSQKEFCSLVGSIFLVRSILLPLQNGVLIYVLQAFVDDEKAPKRDFRSKAKPIKFIWRTRNPFSSLVDVIQATTSTNLIKALIGKVRTGIG
ncbi:hypothetical protein LguiB_031892 [Lonicera macranthoides]